MNGLRRVAQLWIGLALYGISMDFMVRARLGLDPWDVLHQGLSRLLGLSMGRIVILVGLIVLLAWIPLRQRPGFGTVSNAVLIGAVFDAVLPTIPVTGSVPFRVLMLVVGVVLCAVATGMYISVGWGAGPRDGLMTGLARRTGRSVRLVRTSLEVTVLVVGFALGGSVGVGTVVFAVTIGPLAQLFLRLFGHGRPDARAEASLATAVSAGG